jgi:competence protein ComEC
VVSQKIVLGLLMFLILLLLPVYLPGDSKRKLIVWNVGQGQWVTVIQGEDCLHFDAGGEFAPWDAIRKLCGDKMNHIYLSHWDTDHISFVPLLARKMPACIESIGPGPVTHKKLQRIIRIPHCSETVNGLWNWRPRIGRSANDWSQVFAIDGAVIPGDSPKSQEKFWLQLLPPALAMRILILGHHGSRTSTSLGLLARLQFLRMAIASARERRYGHPHAQTVELLQRMGVPLLRTEDWGSIVLEI